MAADSITRNQRRELNLFFDGLLLENCRIPLCKLCRVTCFLDLQRPYVVDYRKLFLLTVQYGMLSRMKALVY